MFKKTISFVLSVMLAVGSISATAISASAQIDTKEEYTPSQGTETRRYYFMMPEDWKNEYAETCGIYWWAGTDPADPWPGYTANKTEFENIYYCDVPADVSTIIWNNAFNGGEDQSASEYAYAKQTVNVSVEYYEPGECEIYPNGIDAETGFDNMICVIDPESIKGGWSSSKITYSVEWYYYYGDGTYSWYPTKAEAVKAGKVFDSEYLVLEDVFEKPETSLTVNATSNFFPEANAVYNADTNEVTVTYTIKGTKNLLNTQWNLYYDSSVLAVSDKNTTSTVMPTCSSGSLINLKLDGKIKANASAIELYDITSEETVFCEVIFDVLDLTDKTTVNTTIELDVEELTYSVVPEGEEVSDDDFDVAVVTGSVVQDNADAKDTVRNTKLTESTFVPSTEPSTEATEPSTEATEPSTEVTEPSTEATEPSTEATEPSTEATEPSTEATEPSTEATEPSTEPSTEPTEDTTGVDVDGDSDSDAPTKPSADTNADNKDNNSNNSNGSVQTGDASTAFGIFALFVVAVGVMYTLRKKEIF